MYTHLLLATDGSEVARRGIDHGLSLAKTLGAAVTVVCATEPFPLTTRGVGAGWVMSDAERVSYEKAQKDFAGGVLKAVKEAADKIGVAAATVHVADAFPATAILDTAKSAGCNLIVMASHGRRGLGRLLLGSQTSEVLAHSPVPVLVVR